MAKVKFDLLESGAKIYKNGEVEFLVEEVMTDIRKALIMDMTSQEEKTLTASTIERWYQTESTVAPKAEVVEPKVTGDKEVVKPATGPKVATGPKLGKSPKISMPKVAPKEVVAEVKEVPVEEVKAEEQAVVAEVLEPEVAQPELTNMEKTVMLEIKEDNFYDGGNSAIWTNTFLDDNCSLDSKKARGVLASLVKKDLILMGKETIEYTEKGLAIAHSIDPETVEKEAEVAQPELDENGEELAVQESTPAPKATKNLSDFVLETVNAITGYIESNDSMKSAQRRDNQSYTGYAKKRMFVEIHPTKKWVSILVRSKALNLAQLESVKVMPKSYGWVVDARFTIKTEDDIPTALDLIESSFLNASLD